MDATRGLLNAAGAKFITSLTGLLASILWTIGLRRSMARLSTASDEVVRQIGRVISPSGGEMAVVAQLQQGAEIGRSSADIAQRSQLHVDLTEELLNEARDQTGTFKRFETDLAVSLARAITTAFSPQMEAMTERLTGAINALSDRLGTMNQAALQEMIERFGTLLKEATDSEMTQLRKTLESLSERLEGAGQAIGSGAGEAAEKLDRAGTDLLARVEQVSQSLGAGALQSRRRCAGREGSDERSGRHYPERRRAGKAGIGVRARIARYRRRGVRPARSAAEELKATGTTLDRVSGALTNAVDSVEEMVQEQRKVVDAVRTATPEAMSSVQRVVDLLQQSVQSMSATMNQTRDAMSATSRTLHETVAQITAGVSEYSNQVAELHRKMDNELAKAVGGMHKGIEELEGAIEELGETVLARRAA